MGVFLGTMMRNAVKEKCGYMMLIIVVGFMLVQTYTGKDEQEFMGDIIYGFSDSERERINQIMSVESSENEIDIRSPKENEYITNLDEKIDEESLTLSKSVDLLPKKSEHTPYVPSLEIIRSPTLTKPQNIVHQKSFIDIGMILINLQKTQKFDPKFEW